MGNKIKAVRECAKDTMKIGLEILKIPTIPLVLPYHYRRLSNLKNSGAYGEYYLSLIITSTLFVFPSSTILSGLGIYRYNPYMLGTGIGLASTNIGSLIYEKYRKRLEELNKNENNSENSSELEQKVENKQETESKDKKDNKKQESEEEQKNESVYVVRIRE